MGIILFQIFIILTLLLARAAGGNKLVHACIAWTVFTFVFVFTMPLMIVQFLIIWGVYNFICKKDKYVVNLSNKTEQQKEKRLINSENNKNIFISNLNQEILRTKIVQEVIYPIELQIYSEKLFIEFIFRATKRDIEIDDLCADPLKKLAYKKARDFFDKTKSSNSDDKNFYKNTLKTIDFSFPASYLGADIKNDIKKRIDNLKRNHEEFIENTFKELRSSSRLEKYFWENLNKQNQPIILKKLKSLFNKTFDQKQIQYKKYTNKQNENIDIVFAYTKNSQKENLENKFNINSKKQNIRSYAEQRRIPYLIHFTQIENLTSIMKCGLQSVSAMQEKNIRFQKNDTLRLDNYKSAISLSVTHPNEKLFYRWRMNNPHQQWVVLLLDISILWKFDIAFCSHNAADRRIRYVERSLLKTEEAFEAMFAEVNNGKSRFDENLQSCDPTDVQSELLVFDAIPENYIIGAVFNEKENLCKYRPMMFRRHIEVNVNNTGLFGLRRVARQKKKG